MERTDWDTLEALYDRLLPLDAAQRAALLQQQLPRIADSLKKMLAADDHPVFMSGHAADAVPEAALLDQVHETIDGYRITAAVATGGMGRVFKAQRMDSDAPVPVALKLMRVELFSDALKTRFNNEKKFLADLQHPHIAALIDAGLHHNIPYLVTQWVDGLSLDVWCREKRPDLATRLHLFLQICGAVAHAHNRLIIHRDLKPGNILVDRHGQAKLLDFGIAKWLDEEAHIARNTQAFTPDYAAPEQLTGDAVGVTTDVYALGLLLFELITGAPRFDLAEQPLADKIKAICQPQPCTPSACMAPHSPLQAAQVRGDLDAVINKAMHREPARRHATVHALAEDVRNFLRHRPVSAVPDGPMYRLRLFLFRHPYTTLLTLGLLLSLLGGLLLTTHQTRRAQAALQQAEHEALKNRQMLDFFMHVLQQASPVAGGSARISVEEMFNNAAQELDLTRISDPRLRAEIGLQIGDVYAHLGQYKQQARLAMGAAEQFAEQLPGTADLYLQSHILAANAQLDMEQYERGIEALEPALQRATAAGVSALKRLEAGIVLAALLRGRGDNERAAALLDALLPLATELNDHNRLGQIRYYQYLLQQDSASPEQLAAWLELAQTHFQAAYDHPHPNLISVRNALAMRLKEQGAYRRVDQMYRAIRADYLQLYGTLDSSFLINHADALFYLGHFDQVIDLTAQALEILQQQNVAEGINWHAAQIIRARALTEINRFAEAWPLLQAAEAFFSQNQAPDGVIMTTLRSYQIDHLSKAGDLPAARQRAQGLLALAEGLLNDSVSSQRRYVNTLTILANLALTDGHSAEALALYDKAWSVHQHNNSGEGWLHVFLRAARAHCRAQLGLAHDAQALTQARAELAAQLPADHWYHGLLQ